MKKLTILVLSLLLLVGCSTKKTEESTTATSSPETTEKTSYTYKVLSPKGAPTLSIIPFLQNDQNTVETVDGSDVIQAALLNPNSDYDVIIAPSNLGAKLASTNKTTYKMFSIVTWGNLYVVGKTEDSLVNGKVALFGEGAVPGLVYETVVKDASKDITYYNSVTEAQAALLSGKADAALLAEPAATATIAKAKENGLELTIIKDLQELWKTEFTNEGYPQAAVFIKQEDYDKDPAKFEQLFEDMTSYVALINENKDQLTTDVDAIGVDVLGIPNGKIAAATLARMNVKIVKAKESEKELLDFLKLFKIEDLTNTIIK